MSPEAAIKSAVPKSGCVTIIAVGMAISTPITMKIAKGQRQRPLVHVPGAGHRHRQLHDLGGLKAHEADVEPALRALADMAGDVDHNEQKHAEHVGDGREHAQVLRRCEFGERQHGGDRDADVRQMVLHHLPVLPGCAIDHQDADQDDDGEHAGQRPVQAKRAQACGRRR